MRLRQLFEDSARRIVAVMPGGFHPFHPGHKSLYDWAVQTFGKDNVYVAATNDTAVRPFPFEVKKQLAAMVGVPKDKFIQVKSPFNVMSYSNLLEPDAAIVFVRSVKDKTEQPLPDQTKKNGEPGYLKTYTGKNLDTADQSGYMAYGPTINFAFSGMQIKSASELRNAWPNMTPEDKLKAAKLMYGNGAPIAVQLLDQALSTDSTNESNPFTDARMNAIKAGKTMFKVGGKTYKVTGDTSDEEDASKRDVSETIHKIDDNKWRLYSKDGKKNLGTFNSLAAAKKHEREVQYFKHNEDQHPNERPRGPEIKPTMPAGTVKVDVSDVYDWYKLGQHISNLDGLGNHDFGKGPPSTIIAFGSEEEEHAYIKNLKKLGLTTTDIDPFDPKQPKSMPRQKTDPTYNVENFDDGKNPERKGLAKRVGVNTKASVSSLRKTAKSSSGEKQRMAHWLANMKAGKAKAKK